MRGVDVGWSVYSTTAFMSRIIGMDDLLGEAIDYGSLFDRASRAATPAECVDCVLEIDRALAAVEAPADRGRLLMCRARVRSNEWRTAEVCADARTAMDLFDLAGEQELALDAASWAAAHASRLGELSLAAELATRCIQALDSVSDERVRMEIFNRLGIFCISFLDYRRAIEQFELSLAAAERLGDEDKVCRQLHNIADGLLLACRHARQFQGQIDGESLSRAELVVAELHARATEDFVRRSGCDRLRAEVLCERGRLREALEVLQRTQDRASVTAPANQRAALAWIRARCLRLSGRPNEAVAAAGEAVQITETSHDSHELMLALEELAASQEAAGDLTGGLASVRKVYARMWTIHQGQTQQLVREVWARADLIRDRRRLESQAAEASHRAELDALTAIGNRRMLARFVQEATVRQAEIAIIIVDLDRFKEINDSLGHDLGDRVLQRVAQILEAAVRAGQVAIRYGGDEFVLGLSGLSPSKPTAIAERIRAAIAGQNWDSLRPGLAITATLGVATGPANQSQAVLSAADAALYAAKQSGRNAVSTGPTWVSDHQVCEIQR